MMAFGNVDGMTVIHRDLAPGLAASQPWSRLHNINAHNGKWIKTGLQSSGPR
jgi:hypothetical protein